jgi:hypothetical protein
VFDVQSWKTGLQERRSLEVSPTKTWCTWARHWYIIQVPYESYTQTWFQAATPLAIKQTLPTSTNTLVVCELDPRPHHFYTTRRIQHWVHYHYRSRHRSWLIMYISTPSLRITVAVANVWHWYRRHELPACSS